MLLALESAELVLMLLSFAGMLGFAGLALWLWLRQSRRQRSSPRSLVAAMGQSAPPAPAGSPPLESGAPVDGTELMIPAFARADVPGAEAESRTELVAPLEANPDRTELVAPPPSVTPAADKTALVAPPPPVEPAADKTALVAPPPPVEPAADKTEFVAPPPPAEPAADKTELVAPPPVVEPPRPPAAETPPGSRPAAPSPAPSSPSPGGATKATVDLREHVELATEAFVRFEGSAGAATADESARTTWLNHLEVLASAPADELLALLRPALGHESELRRAAAWRSLIANKRWPAARELPGLVETLGEPARDSLFVVLASWEDPSARKLAEAGLAGASEDPLRARWLELFAARGWPAGSEHLDEALASSTPTLLAAGLRALPHADPDPARRARVDAHLFASAAPVRVQAIESALAFANQSAWLVCRQLARNPAFAPAAELVGSLGTALEVAELARALDQAPTPALLWALGLAGRRSALEACLAHLDDSDESIAAAAREALALATGAPCASAEDARDAWRSLPETSEPRDLRLIGGAPRTADRLADAWIDASPKLRRALARELVVRSHGKLALPPETLPSARRGQSERLRALDLDLDRGFPWS